MAAALRASSSRCACSAALTTGCGTSGSTVVFFVSLDLANLPCLAGRVSLGCDSSLAGCSVLPAFSVPVFASLAAFNLAASACALAFSSAAFSAAALSASAFSAAAFSASALAASAAAACILTFSASALAVSVDISAEGITTARLRRRVSTFTPPTVLSSVLVRRTLMVPPPSLPFFFCR